MCKSNFSIQASIFFVSIILAIIIQNMRSDMANLNSISLAILGSAPSFFYVFGSLALIPVIKPNLTIQGYIKAALFFTIGACVYEITQLWTDSQFDLLDLFASAIAFVMAVFVYRKNYHEME